MRFLALDKIESPDEARDLAITWQKWQTNHAMSYAEAIDWQAYFETLANKFPELADEFKENGIL